MENKKIRIVFYQDDRSFDYDSPFGTKTHYVFDDNGIEIELDKDDEPILSTLKGFGDFEDVEKCKCLSELYDYIDKNIKYCYVWNNEKEKIYTPWLECLRLQQSIIKAALNGEPMTEEEREQAQKDQWANDEVKRLREVEIFGA